MFYQKIIKSNHYSHKCFHCQHPLNTKFIINKKNHLPLNRRKYKANIKTDISETACLTSQQALENLIKSRDLSQKDVCHVIDELLDTNDPVRIGAFLVLLSVKGETADEIAGLAESMKKNAVKVELPYDVIDIVGTGGDGVGSVNISTGATVIAAAAGAKVAKHGIRSVSSLCGSADVLEELGVYLELPAEGVKYCIDKCGIGFMFAPIYHPKMLKIKEVRQSLKVKTAFNILGPMLNPAEAKYGLIGVYAVDLMKIMADAFRKLGVKKAYIVHSMGMDELTPMGSANILEVTNKSAKSYIVNPRDYGIPKCEIEDLKGGDKRTNAQMLLDVFSGCKGHVSDAINLNAGFALAACNLAKNPNEGVAMAIEVQRSGKAGDKLKEWTRASEEAMKIKH